MTALLLAAGVLAAQDLCWDVKQGYNAVARMVRSPRSERRPETFYFGETKTMEACQLACDRVPECAAFAWMGPPKGGWAGKMGGDKWAQQCYGRGKQHMTMVPEADRVSGVKVPCAQLEELERSFGVDPSRLQRPTRVSQAEAEGGQAEPSAAKARARAGGVEGGAGAGGGSPLEQMLAARRKAQAQEAAGGEGGGGSTGAAPARNVASVAASGAVEDRSAEAMAGASGVGRSRMGQSSRMGTGGMRRMGDSGGASSAGPSAGQTPGAGSSQRQPSPQRAPAEAVPRSGRSAPPSDVPAAQLVDSGMDEMD